MSKLSRTARRRNVAIEGAKILVTSAALIATIGGWAAISAGDAATETDSVAQVVATTAAPTATPSADATSAGTTTELGQADVTATTAPSATPTELGQAVAPTATAVPTQAPLPTQPVRIRTRSSR